jgi:hypothetical protein
MSPRRKIAAVVVATAVVVAPSAAVAGGRLFPPRPGTTVSVLPAGQDNPSIADGVAIGKNVAIYKTSGLGPSALNTAAPAPPMVVNPARPSRFALEIENLPVNGWLVEVEVDAAYPS